MISLCTHCGKEFASPASLKKQNTNVHDEEKRSCPSCQKEIFGKKKYLNHLATHETITCYFSLKRHEETHRFSVVRSKGTLNMWCSQKDPCPHTTVVELDILLHVKWQSGDHLLIQPHHYNCPPVCENKFLLLILFWWICSANIVPGQIVQSKFY